jgi:glycosyltransferase involved in cell wall biosynthesis
MEASVPDLSVVLPVYNQADHLLQLVQGHTDVLDRLGWPYELVLVLNACTDESARVARELTGRHPSLRVVELERGGWGLAVRAGLREARGHMLCYTNSARTTPEMLVLHLSYARAYPSVVVKANRKIRDNWRRRLGSLIYNLECRALFDLAWWDVNGTPKVFPRAFSALLGLQREDDLIDAEFSAICREEGYPVIEIPVLSTQRIGGKSTTNYGSALKMYAGALAVKRSRNHR